VGIGCSCGCGCVAAPVNPRMTMSTIACHRTGIIARRRKSRPATTRYGRWSL
jgi:hypothetical protein